MEILLYERTHQLLSNAETLRKRNIEVVVVFESTTARMREYLTEGQYPIRFIAIRITGYTNSTALNDPFLKCSAVWRME
jgi:hypothetical protein